MSRAANCGPPKDGGQDFPYLQTIQFTKNAFYPRMAKMSKTICDSLHKVMQQRQTHLLALFGVELNGPHVITGND